MIIFVGSHHRKSESLILITSGMASLKVTVQSLYALCVCNYCQQKPTEANKPGKLKRHLDTKHPQYKDRDTSFFKRKEKEYVKQRSKMKKMATVTEKALKASYLTSLRMPKCKKAHTIGEELLQPAAVEMCELMVGPEAAYQLWLIPLSNSTIHRHIEDM